MAAGDWLEQLEAQLERQLEAFLASNPAQQALLQEQEARDRQAQLVGERSRLQRQAEQQRQRLLEMGCHLGQGYLFGRPAPLNAAPWDATVD